MSTTEAIILGIIQGLTEFLPVSSSGHLELGKALLGVKISDNLLFSVIVHAATMLSTVVVFYKDIGQIIKDLFKFEWNESTQFAAKIVVSMIPVGVVGVFFKSEVEQFFEGNIISVGFMLCLTGMLLLITHFLRHRQGGEVTFGKAVAIGIAQAVAILPGISRSGATISTAILVGTDRSKAARFSFLMVLLPIVGATILEMKDYFEQTSENQDLGSIVLIIGFLAAFISGLIACKWMIEIVKKGKLVYFAAYCFLVGILAIAFS